MAQFLNTSKITVAIEELISTAKEELILISPYLQINELIRNLLSAACRLNLKMLVVYREDKHQPDIKWLNDHHIPTLCLDKLHAKCYINEGQCIVTSLNLYDFSQSNNYEMGILISRLDDADLYHEVYKYAQFIIETAKPHTSPVKISGALKEAESSLYKKLSFKSKAELNKKLVAQGYLVLKNYKYELTDKGRSAGGKVAVKKNGNEYIAWPSDFEF